MRAAACSTARRTRRSLSSPRRRAFPVGETQAGKGALRYDQPQNLGAIGVTGTSGANIMAREADLVIGIGTRYSDFTTASKTAFQNPKVQFININVAEFDAFKHSALPVLADARAALRNLSKAVARLAGFGWLPEARREIQSGLGQGSGPASITRHGRRSARPKSSAPSTILPARRTWCCAPPAVCPAICTGSGVPVIRRATTWNMVTPAWATKSRAVSGVKMAAPDREVYVMVGDGSWLMMSSEVVTAIQEGFKLTIVLSTITASRASADSAEVLATKAWAPTIGIVEGTNTMANCPRRFRRQRCESRRLYYALAPARNSNRLSEARKQPGLRSSSWKLPTTTRPRLRIVVGCADR